MGSINETKKKEKILFCYLSPRKVSYTPTDIGYVIALLEKELPGKYEYEIVELTYGIDRTTLTEEERKREDLSLQQDAAVILYHRPSAIFIFSENLLWSRTSAFNRAIRVSKEIKKNAPNAFIGIQSYKVSKEHATNSLAAGICEAVITEDIELSFLKMQNILRKEYVPGVWYRDPASHASNSCTACATETPYADIDNLDMLPSPYLTGVFDNFIQIRQLETENRFRPFLITSRGCRFKCFYCFRSIKFDKVRYFSPQRFYDEMEYLLNNFNVKNFYILDDAFLFSRFRLKEFVKEFLLRLTSNEKLHDIKVFMMARPESIDEEIVEILATLKVCFIQIGLQTVNPELQYYMGRSVDALYFKKIQEWLQKFSIDLHLDIIVGLPYDSAEWMKETLRFALLLNPRNIQIKQFYLNPSTLFSLRKEEYGIKVKEGVLDYDTPFVIEAKGLDKEYFEETNAFILQQIEENPHIGWKYVSNLKRVVNKAYQGLSYGSKDYKLSRHPGHFDLLWIVNADNLFSSLFQNEAFVLDEKNIYVQNEGFVFAFSQIDGHILWKRKINFFNKTDTSSRLYSCGEVICLILVNKGMFCLSKSSGEYVWFDMNASSTNQGLVDDHTIAYLTEQKSFFKKKQSITIVDVVEKRKILECVSEVQLQKLVARDNNGEFFVGIEGDYVYSISQKSGKILWRHELCGAKDAFFIFDKSSRYIFFFLLNKQVLRIDAETGEEKDIVILDREIQSTPVLHNGSLIVHSIDNDVLRMSDDTGKMIWKFKATDQITTPMYVYENSVFFGTTHGNLLELDVETGKIRSQYVLNDEIVQVLYSAHSKRFFVHTKQKGVMCFSKKTEAHSFSLNKNANK